MSDDSTPSARCDARGLLCPLPVLKARKRLEPLAEGDILELITDDPAAIIDVPHFCTEAGHKLQASNEWQDGAHLWRIAKGQAESRG